MNGKTATLLSCALRLVLTARYADAAEATQGEPTHLPSMLLSKYPKHTAPNEESPGKKPLQVNVTAGLWQVVELNQQRSLITVSAYVAMRWNDHHLKWNPSEWNGRQAIFLPYSELWMPEVYLYYGVGGADDARSVYGIKMHAKIRHTGDVQAYIPFTGNTLCPLDVKHFPFDAQKCTLRFGPWTYSKDMVKFNAMSNKADLEEFYDNQEWVLKYATMREDVVERLDYGEMKNFSVIEIEVKLQREWFYYVFNLVLPSTMITLVSLLGFHFPGASKGVRKAKFRLGITTLLSMSVLILTVSRDLPRFSYKAVEGKRGSFSAVPIIVIYYVFLLSIISLATVTGSIPIFVESNIMKSHRKFPSWLKWIVWPHPTTESARWRFKLNAEDMAKAMPEEKTKLVDSVKVSKSQSEDEINNYHTKAVQKAVQDLVSEVRQCLTGVQDFLNDCNPEKPDFNHHLWRVLLFRIEMIFLFIYLSLTFTAMSLFFFPGWY